MNPVPGNVQTCNLPAIRGIMSTGCRTALFRIGLAAIAVTLACAALAAPSTADPGIGDLNSQLGHEQSRQRTLVASIDRLSHNISTLDGQIALVRSREADVRSELDRDRAQLTRIRTRLTHERRLVVVLKARLVRARAVLSRQLVSNYERDKPDLIGVVLDARGFNDLLEQLDFLRRAQGQTQAIIQVTRTDKAAADKAQRRLSGLEATEVRVTNAAATREEALAGMNSLLETEETALARARSAQRITLSASRARGSRLRNAIARAQAARAAAARAAAAQPQAPSTHTSAPSSGASPLGPNGGWAIPYSIVLCETGGTNVPPNGATASGYYAIVSAAWKQYGGSGPAAYLAPKSEQDAVARRIWDAVGPKAWVCAGIVGID
jgi:septal ring factor EnvC (AmiA/AmiB activator)